jgi:hypothetical protein
MQAVTRNGMTRCFTTKVKTNKTIWSKLLYKYGGALGMKALEVNKFKALGMIGEIKESFEKQ